MPPFSHYEPLDDISYRLAIPSLVFCAVTPLVVIARFGARRAYGNNLGADDWTILASLVFAQTVNIQMLICCHWGFGKHTDLLPRSIVSKTLELYFYAQILYKINIGLTKVSILIFYLRVFNVLRWFKILCWTVVGLVISFTVASVTTSIFQCSPVRYAYDKSGPEGSCINLTKFWYGNAGYNIGTDLIIIIIPVLVIRSLHVPKRSRLALVTIFGLGMFVCITSVLRFTTLDISTVRTDSMWQSINSSMWTIIESNLAIIVACMPALRQIIVQFFPFHIGKSRKTTASPESSRSRTMPPPSRSRVSDPRHTEKQANSKGETWMDDDFEAEDDNLALGNGLSKGVTAKGEVYDMEEIAESARKSTRTMI